nr:hypothetical protein [Tanacetum cinerariifolium]
MCVVPSHDNSSPLDVSKDQIEDFSKPNEEFSTIDDDSFSIDTIDYVVASLPDSELVSSEERSDSLDDNIISGLPSFSAITPNEPVLSTKEPDNSLSMGDEHIDTILATKSDKFIKSGVENLIPIPSESEGIPEHVCDMPFHDNSPPLDVSTDQIEDFSESNKEFSSIDDDSFSIDTIDYVEASPLDSELVSSEVMEIVIPSPPQINHHCCYGCGDPLEDIFCHQCTCELYGNGAHYGYNCPPKVLIVPNPKPLNNQTIKELLQTLPSFDPTCYSEDGNSFTYDSTSNLVHDSPNFPVIHQPIREKTYAELLAEEQEANIDTHPFQYFVVPQPPQEEMSVEFLREKRNQMDYLKTFLRKFNRISFYEMQKVLSLARETILEIELAFEDKHCQPEDIMELFRRLHNDVQNIHEELAVYINTPNWDRPTICYDDDDEDYAIAVTPSLSIEEPDNSLSMGDEHLDTIPATKSDEFIKSSVENLVPIPSESNGIPDNISEVMEIVIPEVGGIDDDILLTIKDDILHKKMLNVNLLIANIKALNDNPAPSSDFMTKSSSTSLNSLLEETNTFDNYLPELETFCFDLEEISSDSTTICSDISLPEYEAFYDDHVKEIRSGSTTTHSDSSLYDS